MMEQASHAAGTKGCDVLTVTRLGKIVLGIAIVLFSVAASAGTVSHRVRNGDTLWDLAKKHGVTPKQIAQANGISENATLPLDKVLRIPTKDSPKSSKRAKSPLASHRHTTSRVAATAKSTRSTNAGDEVARNSETSGTDNGSLVRMALALRGSRYRRGGVSRSGFDCSGFTRYVYDKYGITLPHNSAAQSSIGRPVSRNELRPGDLVFFQTRGRRIGHVALYIGNDRIVHAATYGKGVRVDSLSSGYYSRRYRCARRVK